MFDFLVFFWENLKIKIFKKICYISIFFLKIEKKIIEKWSSENREKMQ